jgi:hypothetical protein
MESEKEKEVDESVNFEEQWQSETDGHEYYVLWWYASDE